MTILWHWRKHYQTSSFQRTKHNSRRAGEHTHLVTHQLAPTMAGDGTSISVDKVRGMGGRVWNDIGVIISISVYRPTLSAVVIKWRTKLSILNTSTWNHGRRARHHAARGISAARPKRPRSIARIKWKYFGGVKRERAYPRLLTK